MDRKTERELQKINGSIPSDLLKGLVKIEKDETEENMARAIVKNRAISEDGRRAVKKSLDRGDFKSAPREVVDQDNQKKISDYLDYQLKKALKSGKIKPAQSDSFTDYMRSKMNP